MAGWATGVKWFQNGDHPLDGVGQQEWDPISLEWYERLEGAVVRFFRHPDYPDGGIHATCGRTWHDHGFLDGKQKYIVCPGDWVMRGEDGEYYAERDLDIEPQDFEQDFPHDQH